MTEVLRRILDQHFAGGGGTTAFRKEAVLSFVGLGASGRCDTSEAHDAALTDAFAFDAQIVALCREVGVRALLTEDRDFARFTGFSTERL